MRNKNPATVTVAVLFGAFLVPWLAASAQETPADDLMTVGHYLDMERVSGPQISPDGSQIVFVRSWVDKQNDQFESAIWIMDADGRRPRFLIEGGNPRWSPNGDRIAYLASGEQGTPQIFVRWMDEEGAVTPVTREQEAPSNFRWSPDGSHLYFQRFVPRSKPWPIDLPAAPEGAEWTPPPAHRRPNPLPHGPDRFSGRGLHTPFPGPERGRHGPAAYQRRVERRCHIRSRSRECGL